MKKFIVATPFINTIAVQSDRFVLNAWENRPGLLVRGRSIGFGPVSLTQC